MNVTRHEMVTELAELLEDFERGIEDAQDHLGITEGEIIDVEPEDHLYISGFDEVHDALYRARSAVEHAQGQILKLEENQERICELIERLVPELGGGTVENTTPILTTMTAGTLLLGNGSGALTGTTSNVVLGP